ncbi:hypothetical protein QVD17_20510 [Tagetes erecta]|uniref:Uncharacterized protein n=1 Tax=Tagetes erecta TaxID=13708 RepID=A0AAD8NY74_TARER|nr:hypothetical protein QVD17_20510 [Tagetes erecta]
MSLKNEDDSLVMEASESNDESEMKQRISYSRDFLISLGELEICKSLPSGFDQSILREFEENIIQERSRTHGNSPLQGLRRNDYSSSPPTRDDSSNLSRGAYGRWDKRSSGWGDKDGDSQSDLDPDSGRRNYGNQSRRLWQNSEHDGLLGSGSFPRPLGFAGAPKGSTNEHYHLNRSNEAYQPPRPFKAVPASRPNTHDSFNDETFGDIESTTQDRAEEERKRRASFELMRKEQQKVLQEKQKTSANKVKSDGFTDLTLEAKEEVFLETSGELNSTVQSVPNDDSGKPNTLLQSSKPRPLVPPGFKSTVFEKSSTTKPISSTEKENPKPRIEEIHSLGKSNHTQNETLENKGSILSGDHHSNRISGFPEVLEVVDGEVFELMPNKIRGKKVTSNSSLESTTSILGKIFGSDPTIKDGGPTGFSEKSKPDSLSPRDVHSSRFAQWFNDNEKKPVGDFSSNRPNDLLSLIGFGGEKANDITTESSYKGFGIAKVPSDPKHLFSNFSQESAPPPVSAVLTCEDLEQTILSEYSDKSSNLLPPVPDRSVSNIESVDARAVDSQATHRLLSLLQKGTVIENGPNMNTGPFEARPTSENPKDVNNQEDANSGQNHPLEALFGTAFMKELQSAQAPVSAQRAPPGSARTDAFEPHDSSVSNANGLGPSMKNYETKPLSSKQNHFDGQRAELDPSVFTKQTIGMGEIHLPEESLIIAGDVANTLNSNTGKMLPADMVFGISEKLAVLNSGFSGRGPYDMLEPERQFNNNQKQRPMAHPSDTNPQHMNPQMRFPDHLMQRDKFSGNMHVPPFHHPDARVTGFDVPVNANLGSQMLPQMRMQGNFPPPHLLHDLPKSQASNFMPYHGFPFAHQQSNIGGPGLPLSVPVAVSSSGSNHPEALQRMIEMELRAQSERVRPVNAGHGQEVYGHAHELDMSFRYR